MSPVRVAMIGYRFMGKTHSFGYMNLPLAFGAQYAVVRKVLVGRNAEELHGAAAAYGWEETETDWRRVLERKDVDLIDIGTPGDTHAEIAIAAAQAGKHVICEKPLANNMAEARRMLEAVRKAGVKHMVAFNARRIPAIVLAKELIDEGRLGPIRHWRARWLSDWIMPEGFPLVWRLRKDKAGAGALGDIGAHIIDLAHYLVGDIERVVGAWDTFRKERPLEEDPTRTGPVTVDDGAAFLARFANGAMGVFEATRYAAGNKDHYSFEINGERGSLRWDYSEANKLDYFTWDDPEREGGFRAIYAGTPRHKYASAWWPDGHYTHYGETFVSQAYELIAALQEGRDPVPGFEVGVRCQAVIEAVAESILEERWTRVSA